jgi:hypothetical protein
MEILGCLSEGKQLPGHGRLRQPRRGARDSPSLRDAQLVVPLLLVANMVSFRDDSPVSPVRQRALVPPDVPNGQVAACLRAAVSLSRVSKETWPVRMQLV